MTPERRGASPIRQANNRVTIDRRRHGLAERELPKPSPPGRRFSRPVRRRIVLVEEQELVGQSGAKILELVFAARLILQEQLEVGRAQLRRYVRLAGLEPHRLCVFARHEHEQHPIEIRQLRRRRGLPSSSSGCARAPAADRAHAQRNGTAPILPSRWLACAGSTLRRVCPPDTVAREDGAAASQRCRTAVRPLEYGSAMSTCTEY